MRLPPDLAARLKAEADARGVPVPWLVARILRAALDEPRGLPRADADPITKGLVVGRGKAPKYPPPPPYRPDRGLIGYAERPQSPPPETPDQTPG